MSGSPESSPNRTDAREKKNSNEPSLGALPYVLPFFTVLGLGMLIPVDFAPPAYETAGQKLADPNAPTTYTVLVGVQFILGLGIVGYFSRLLFKNFPLKISPLAPLVGVIGIFVWIGICEIGIEQKLYPLIGLGWLVEVRPAFDPFAFIESASMRWFFLVLRFGLLAITIPLIEELFVRGWFARWIGGDDWELTKLSELKQPALWAIIGYAVLTHPSEILAAIAWFWLVNWLMLKTGNLWDCVVAHMMTNFLLGLYVVNYSQWQLW